MSKRHTPPFGHPSQEGTLVVRACWNWGLQLRNVYPKRHTPPFGHPSQEGTLAVQAIERREVLGCFAIFGTLAAAKLERGNRRERGMKLPMNRAFGAPVFSGAHT
jgi:hypothetical protein